MRGKSFKDLIVWQRSIELVQEIYTLTKQLPKEEQFCLTSQLRRASISIPSNIAEGAKRGTPKDFLQFLRIASGSAAEVETQLIILARQYPTLHQGKTGSLLEEVQKMLTVLVRTVH